MIQLYDGISVPLANVTTSTVNVSPTLCPMLLVSAVEVLLRNVPAADSQLIEAENLAPGGIRFSSVSRRYVILHESVTFGPRIGGFVTTPHVGFRSETRKISRLLRMLCIDQLYVYDNRVGKMRPK